MGQWSSTEDILNFAIKNEEEAAAFYKDLAGKVDSASMKKVFEEFAAEEEGHKAKLLGVKSSGSMEPAAKEVLDLKIGDYLVDAQAEPNMDYQQILILAMKQEKAAFKLYTDLAAVTRNSGLRDLLLALAQEEAKHKLRFEIEYDDNILTEN